MRYHIDTIPVWDAMKLLSECPLCAIRRKTELNDIQRFLGGSVMEPDVRIQVNSKGFCSHHQQMLFNESNKLGHALMLHTHLVETENLLSSYFDGLASTADKGSRSGFFSRNAEKASLSKDGLQKIADNIATLSNACIICDSITENMHRYAYNFVHLWKTDEEFKKAFAASKGVCLPDLALLLKTAPDVLSSSQLSEFVRILIDLQKTQLKRVEENIFFFTQKFDYRNQDKPWGDSRNAIERTVNKLQGWCVGDEPNPKERK